MTLIHQAKKLLKRIKKAQQTESGVVYIDFEAMQMFAVTEGEPKKYDVSDFKNCLAPTLDYLKGKNCLNILNPENYHYVQLTSLAWHLKEDRLRDMFRFSIVSFLLPVLVSIVTTLILQLIM